jgi:hypothetical protein
MKAAKILYWNNKWTDIFDFTPNRSKQNHIIEFTRTNDFVVPLVQMQRVLTAAEKLKGEPILSLKRKLSTSINFMAEIGDDDLADIHLDFSFNDYEA